MAKQVVPVGWWGMPGNLSGIAPYKKPPLDRYIRVRNLASRLPSPPPYFGTKEFRARWDVDKSHWVLYGGKDAGQYCHFHLWQDPKDPEAKDVR